MQNGPAAVVAAVVKRADKFLICQRPPHKRHGGLWEFPGGKVEAGETLLQAARRELSEELALNATAAGDLLFSMVDPVSGFEIKFLEVSVDGEPQLSEHTALSWLDAQALLRLPLAPSDKAFVESLNRR